MATVQNKIDFIGFITVERANPNGDPLNGNQPRVTYDGYGEISDVCLKRKIRNRLLDLGEPILMQADDYKIDDYDSIRARVMGNEEAESLLKGKEKNRETLFKALACQLWTDVRSFGQVFALRKETGIDAVSIGVRGPVSIHTAVSVEPIVVTSMQITKSLNGEPNDKKGSDTMGMKHRVDFGVYKFQGSINVQLAELTEFTEEDSEKIKQSLITLFENDASSARPEGSMEVSALYWITHPGKTSVMSTAAVHRSVSVEKKAGIQTPKAFADYLLCEEGLEKLKEEEPGIRIEKYIDGQRA